MTNLPFSSYTTLIALIFLWILKWSFLKLKWSIPHHIWCFNSKWQNAAWFAIYTGKCLSLASVIIFCAISVVKTDTWNVFTGDIIPKHTLALETSEMCGIVNNNALQGAHLNSFVRSTMLAVPTLFLYTARREQHTATLRENMSILNHTPNQGTVWKRSRTLPAPPLQLGK